MKKLLLLLAMIVQTSYGQKMIFKNENSASKSEVLYNSIFNKVVVMLENTPCSDISMKGQNLKIIKGNDCSFYLKIIDPYQSFWVSIYNKEDSISTQYFLPISNDIPLPTLSVGCGKNEYGSLLCNQIDSVFCNPVLSDGYNENIHFSVISFIITIMKAGDEVLFTEFIVGNQISQKGKETIKTLKRFDKMILKKVLIKDDADNYYTIENREFTVF